MICFRKTQADILYLYLDTQIKKLYAMVQQKLWNYFTSLDMSSGARYKKGQTNK